jgi:hypothetical protein
MKDFTIADPNDPIYREPCQIGGMIQTKKEKGSKKRKKKKRRKKGDEELTFTITREEEKEFQEMLEQQRDATHTIRAQSAVIDERLTAFREKILDTLLASEEENEHSLNRYEILGLLTELIRRNERVYEMNALLMETFGEEID